VTSFPKALLVVAAALGVLFFLPGIPAGPVLVIAVVLVSVALLASRQARPDPADAAADDRKDEKPADQDTYGLLKVEPIEVMVGVKLTPLVSGEHTIFMERIAAIRKQVALESGMVLPRVRFRDASQMAANGYELHIFGVVAGRGEIMSERMLAIRGGSEARPIKGIETKEPTYGLPAVWIEDSEKETARLARYTLVDPTTVFITHLTEVLKQHAAALLTRTETDRLLQRVRDEQPGLVEELIPTILSVSDVQKVLQNLLSEKVSIRNLEAILETLVDTARSSKDLGMLTEFVRQKLGGAICNSLVGEQQALQVLTLDPTVEQVLMQSLRNAEPGASLVVEPRFAEQLLARLAAQGEKMMKGNLLPVLLCAPELRRHVRSLSARVLPHMRILSMAEVPNSVNLRSFSSVKV
jgi:flagellar biosynthesis protein FlhA